MILLVLREVLAELQKKPNKGKPRVKQNNLWSEPPRTKKNYDRAGKEWEESRRQNERELAAERQAREAKYGVVVDPVARAAADRLMQRSKAVTG